MEFSYSSLNDYFECPFRFYLSRVLNLDSFEETFSTKAGNFAHKVFENMYKSNFDIDKEIMDNLPFYEFKNEEKYLLERFIINIKVCYELIKERIEDKNITKTYSEKKLKTTLKNGFIFKGTIDSIVETDNKNIFVIDYKSGSFKRRPQMSIRRSTQVGRRGAPAKGVGRETGARVQIPPSPPLLKYTFCGYQVY